MLENHISRVEYDNPKMYRWKSWEPNTPFAPSWDIPIYVDQCGKDIASSLAGIISKTDICKHRDRWQSYNIFNWDYITFAYLCDRIYQVYEEYMNELDYTPLSKDKLWIRGWGTVLEQDQKIEYHSHAFHENTYLSGNLSLSDLDTTTDYFFPNLSWYYGFWKVKNSSGKMTLFPSWVEHQVEPNTTGKVRFSLAFDMFTEHSLEYVSKNRNENSVSQNIILLSKRMDMI